MKKLKVAICIATYKRPKGLAKLLDSLLELRFQKCPGVDLTVIVVDNDQTGSAKLVAEPYCSRLPKLIYDIEAEQNISLARNKAIALAKELDCEYIAFVDDDEFVLPLWLDEMIATMMKYEAQIVIGPVIPVFVEPAPKWVVDGQFYEYPSYKTGERIRWGMTGNVLFQSECLERLEGPFDHRFGLSGGEDTHLFERLYRMGTYIVWSNEAVIRESIPSSRTNIGWILRRAYRFGNTLSLCERALEVSRKWVIIRFAKGVGRMFQGSIMLLPSLLLGYASVIKSLAYIARGVGMIAGMLGCKFEEYKKIHGN